MPEEKPESAPFLQNIQTGLAVGLAVFLLWGFVNALLIIGLTASWFTQFVQGAPIPPGAKTYLWRSTPIFAISSLWHGLMGLVLGGIWGVLWGGYLRIRSRVAETSLDRIVTHTSSFLAFPLFFLAILSFVLMRSIMGKATDPVEAPKQIMFLLALVGASLVLYKLLSLLFRRLFRIPPLRFATTVRGFLTLTASYCLGICVLSFLPTMLTSFDKETKPLILLSNEDRRLSEFPNIMLVVLDTTRADHLSCYGYPKRTTPTLDVLATEGVLFEHAFSPAVWTLPGHASIFTGMAASKHGANGEHLYLDESFTTIAEILESKGYRTAGFSNNAWVSDFTGMDQGFQEYRRMWLKRYAANFLLAHGIYQGIRSLFSEISPPGGVINTTREAFAWIQKRPETPFFLFINLMEPHPPLDYRSKHTEPFLQKGLPPKEAEQVNQNPYVIWAGREAMSRQDFEAYAALYDGELRYLDFHLGQFFDNVRSSGMLDDTLLIVTADHGEQIGEGGFLGHHFSVRDALLRVPLILRYPGRFPQGVRVRKKVQTIDILPTILSVLDIQDPEIWKPLQGKSLLPIQQDRNRPILAEEFQPLLEMKFVKAYKPSFELEQIYGHRTRAYIGDRYKYVHHDNGKEYLYDPLGDPQEIEDLAEALPEILRRLRDRLQEWVTSFKAYPVKEAEFTFQPDKATEEQLRSLGYIQ